MEDHQRGRPQDEVKLAHREIVEAEAQLGRDERVRLLLVRQIDIEADTLGADFEGTAVSRFHDPGTAARHDHELAPSVDLAAAGNQPAELAGMVVKMALFEHALGPLERPGQGRIVG